MLQDIKYSYLGVFWGISDLNGLKFYSQTFQNTHTCTVQGKCVIKHALASCAVSWATWKHKRSGEKRINVILWVVTHLSWHNGCISGYESMHKIYASYQCSEWWPSPYQSPNIQGNHGIFQGYVSGYECIQGMVLISAFSGDPLCTKAQIPRISWNFQGCFSGCNCMQRMVLVSAVSDDPLCAIKAQIPRKSRIFQGCFSGCNCMQRMVLVSAVNDDCLLTKDQISKDILEFSKDNCQIFFWYCACDKKV